LILETACVLLRDLGEDEEFGVAAPAGLTLSGASAKDLRRFVEAQEALLQSAPTMQSAYQLSASGTLGTVFDPQAAVTARLARYLADSEWLGKAGDVTVSRLGSGMSKETYLAERGRAQGSAARLFIRKDSGFSCMLTTVTDEYPLLEILRSFQLPVPEVLLCETDRSICGTPFILIKSVAGSSDPSSWGDEALRGVALQLVEFLARLHSLPLDPILKSKPAWLEPVHMCRSVRGLRATWLQCDFDEPMMEALLDWLEANEPSPAERQVLVHGDAGLHNVLIQDGRIQAVLDWETCHLGNPEEDLLVVRPFLERLMPWPEVVAAYRNYGGQYRDGCNEQFYSLFTLVRITLSLYNIRAALRDRNPMLDTKDAYIGTRYAKRFLVESYKRIIPED